MEENEYQNPMGGNGTKKKGMGPLKIVLIVLVVAVILCAVGLLIRMLVADDGDYAPERYADPFAK